MSRILAIPLDAPGVSPREISQRLRGQLVYFVAPAGDPDAPVLGENEYFFRGPDVERWLEEGVFYLVSPLDTANQTEVEITEEQEDFLGWLVKSKVRHIRIAE